MTHSRTAAPEEQIRYADLLYHGAWLSIVVMSVTYVIYYFGFVTPHIPLEEIPRYWSMPVHDYVEQARIPVGWGWVHMLSRSDFLNFVGIALLALMTIICYFILIAAYFRKKDRAYFLIALAEVVVLCLAASGILGVGGH